MDKHYTIEEPVFEACFEPVFDPGDYDLITLSDGVWVWEHVEYYPEYHVGYLAYAAKMGVPAHLACPVDHAPPDDCPIYGKDVNTIRWELEYLDVEQLIQDLSEEFGQSRLACGHFRSGDGKVGHMLSQSAMVNPDCWRFAPKKQIRCIAKLPSEAPDIRGYTHWLTVNHPFKGALYSIYYPRNPSKYIRVKVLNGSHELIDTIIWAHGRAGLFAKVNNQYGVTEDEPYPLKEFAQLARFYDEKGRGGGEKLK